MLWTDFDEIFWICPKWDEEQVISAQKSKILRLYKNLPNIKSHNVDIPPKNYCFILRRR